MEHLIRIDETDEETLRIYIDGECVGCFDHDEHGYSTMFDVRNLMQNIAIQLDTNVVNR